MTQPHGKVPAALANAIADALLQRDIHNQHHGKPHRHDEKTEYLEFLEAEAADTVQKYIAPILAQMETEGHGKEFLEKLQDPDHPVELLAILIPVLIAAAYQLGGAVLAGPVSAISTVSMRNFGDVKPPPMWAAEKVASGHLDMSDGENWVKDNGMTNVNFMDLVNASKNDAPPGVIIEALRRGIIGGVEAASFLQHNGLTDESIQLYLDMQQTVPSVALAFNAVTQNALTAEAVQDIMRQNGLDVTNYQWMYETNGQSPGVEMLNKLKNYGLISDELWTQGILESPIKNKYVDVLKNTRFHRPPMRTTLSMVHNGVITREKALEYMEFLGFFPDDAANMVDDAIKRKSSGTKDLTAANIRGMYAEGLMDRGTADSKLTALGYDAEESALFLDYADAVRERQRTNRAVSHIRSQYVAHKIDQATAQSALDRLNVTGIQRDEIMQDWILEHEATVRHLTVAEIFKAHTGDFLTDGEVHDRLIAMGYTESDTLLLMEIHGIGVPDSAKLKDLTVAQIVKMLKEERITEADARQRLQNRGYSPGDAQLLIDSALQRPNT